MKKKGIKKRLFIFVTMRNIRDSVEKKVWIVPYLYIESLRHLFEGYYYNFRAKYCL